MTERDCSLIMAQFYLVLSFVLLLVGWSSAQEGTPCDTPLQTAGTCISIKSCDTLLNLLRTQSNNVEVRNYLRRSACGFVGTTPLVCCPRNETPAPSGSGTTESGAEGTPPSTGRAVNQDLLRPPKCGFSNVTTARVVGGIPAKLGEFPWMAALGYRNSKDPNRPKWLCGGSLISDKHVLTAAHCVQNRDDLYVVRLGDLDLYADDDGASPVVVPIAKAKVHEEYNPSAHTGDIAIITLQYKPEAPLVFPICLPLDEPLRSNKFSKYQMLLAGWGSTSFRGPSSSLLQMTALPIVDNDQCRQALSTFRTVIDDTVICAGYTQGGRDACQGDSGGPLMYGKSGSKNYTLFLIGIVSYGYKCAEAGYPGVYTRVPQYIDWIRTNMN